MAQATSTHRFGPDVWVTVGSTGEHVRVELWSNIANAYRVRSAGNGVQFFQETELEEMPPHPDEDFGRHWKRCRAAGCGAPLTAELPVCEKCQSPTCTCGRCACPPASARRVKAKKAAKKPKTAEAKANIEVVADGEVVEEPEVVEEA